MKKSKLSNSHINPFDDKQFANLEHFLPFLLVKKNQSEFLFSVDLGNTSCLLSEVQYMVTSGLRIFLHLQVSLQYFNYMFLTKLHNFR